MAPLAWQSQDIWCSYMGAGFPQSEHPRRTRQAFFDLASLLPHSIDQSNHKPAQTQRKGHRPLPLNSAKEHAAIKKKKKTQIVLFLYVLFPLFFYDPH